MGIKSEFFVASKEELKSVQLNTWPFLPKSFEQFDCWGLTNVELATLEALLTSSKAMSILEIDDTKPVMDGGDDGPWVSPLRPQLIEALFVADPKKIDAISKKWAKTEELVASRWHPNAVDEVLHLLHGLVKTAKKSKKHVYDLLML